MRGKTPLDNNEKICTICIGLRYNWRWYSGSWIVTRAELQYGGGNGEQKVRYVSLLFQHPRRQPASGFSKRWRTSHNPPPMGFNGNALFKLFLSLYMNLFLLLSSYPECNWYCFTVQLLYCYVSTRKNSKHGYTTMYDSGNGDEWRQLDHSAWLQT